MTPTEFFQHVSDALAFVMYAWRASLALVILIFMYRFPFHWESVLIFIGLGMIVASPWLPLSTIGELLFWPGMVVFVSRQYQQNHERYLRDREAKPVAKPIVAYTAAVIKNTLTK